MTCDCEDPVVSKSILPLIRVVHDQSTYYANCDQSYFWSEEKTNVLKNKSLGTSIMVSDFIAEVSGFLTAEKKTIIIAQTSIKTVFQGCQHH